NECEPTLRRELDHPARLVRVRAFCANASGRHLVHQPLRARLAPRELLSRCRSVVILRATFARRGGRVEQAWGFKAVFCHLASGLVHATATAQLSFANTASFTATFNAATKHCRDHITNSLC